jgi:hypothetical protein
MTRNLLALAALFAVALPAHAQVYKCVEGGRTIYSQTPCTSSSRATTISKTAPSAPPPGDAKSSGPQTAAEQEQAFRKRQQEQQEAQKKEGQKLAETQQKQENCNNARSQLAQYEMGGRIAGIDASGERYYLDDGQMAQERAKAQAQVSQWCR